MSRIAALSLLLLPLSVSAIAQAPGYQLAATFERNGLKDADARQSASKYAECHVRRNVRSVRPMLDVPVVKDPRVGRAWLDFMIGACVPMSSTGMGDTTTFPPLALRGVLAEALARRTQPGYPEIDAGVMPSGLSLPIVRGRADDTTANDYVLLMSLASCTVTKDVAGVTKILRSRTASTEESAAFDAISTALGSCFPDKQQAKISYSVMRGAFAEVVYRMIDTNSPSSSKTDG